VISDMVFELRSETAERSRARVLSVDPPKRVTGRRAIPRHASLPRQRLHSARDARVCCAAASDA
jgi:hypothetical protein